MIVEYDKSLNGYITTMCQYGYYSKFSKVADASIVGGSAISESFMEKLVSISEKVGVVTVAICSWGGKHGPRNSRTLLFGKGIEDTRKIVESVNLDLVHVIMAIIKLNMSDLAMEYIQKDKDRAVRLLDFARHLRSVDDFRKFIDELPEVSYVNPDPVGIFDYITDKMVEEASSTILVENVHTR